MKNSKNGIRIFIICILSSSVLIFSWLASPTRYYWDFIDKWIFYSLNGTLKIGGLWNGFWAIANNRLFDAVPGIIILLLLFIWIKKDKTKTIREKIAMILLLGVCIYLFEILLAQLFNFIGYNRFSPSKVMEDSIRLTKIISWIKTKDASSFCFPGDHAIIILMITIFLGMNYNLQQGIKAFLCLFLFIIPRLVSGAHWFTDIFVGSLGFSLLISAFWFGLKFQSYSVKYALNIWDKINHKIFPKTGIIKTKGLLKH